MRIDVSFYAIIDEDSLCGKDPGACARELVSGGATVIQYRAKNLGSRELLSRALAIERAIRTSGVPLIINDRADVAFSCGDSGVHLGIEDVPAAAARKLLGPGRLIGVSVQGVEDAIEAELQGADYLGAGAVFPTGSKDGVLLIGLSGLEEIKRSVSIPVVAIGGLTIGTVAQVLGAGADGLAFISELFRGEDVGARAREIKAAIESARGQ